MNTLQKIYDWIVWSSDNAEKYSFTLKSLITGGALTAILSLIGVVLPTNDINSFIDQAINALKILVELLAALGALFGIARKIMFTFSGHNDLLNKYY